MKVFLKESDVKIILENSYRRLIQEKQFSQLVQQNICQEYVEIIQNYGIGYKGSLKDIKGIDAYTNVSELLSILDNLTYVSEIPENEPIFIMWKQYANAMGRRRPDSILDFWSFFNYLYRCDEAYIFNYEGNYIIGQYSNNFFKVSHFAPKTMRGGVDTLKELMSYNNIVLTVTEDLTDMLTKLGYLSDEKLVIPMFFRDQIVNKKVFTTNPNLIAKAMVEFFKPFSDEENRYRLDTMQNRAEDVFNNTDVEQKEKQSFLLNPEIERKNFVRNRPNTVRKMKYSSI
jgi:hypothetical protein